MGSTKKLCICIVLILDDPENLRKEVKIMKKTLGCLWLCTVIIWGCSSAPEPQAEPSKKEIRQDADGFFKKMQQEEGAAKPANP